MGLLLLVIVVVLTAAEVLLLAVIGLLLLTRLGQICFFLVKTSHYSLVEVFQDLNVAIIHTRFRVNILVSIAHYLLVEDS
jgi:hypothetical protein